MDRAAAADMAVLPPSGTRGYPAHVGPVLPCSRPGLARGSRQEQRGASCLGSCQVAAGMTFDVASVMSRLAGCSPRRWRSWRAGEAPE